MYRQARSKNEKVLGLSYKKTFCWYESIVTINYE
ncbi:hypothetical protein Thaha01_01492 [Tetragenococcus halophilus subsp. halophilus]